MFVIKILFFHLKKELKTNQKIYFITYGNKKFEKSRNRIVKEAYKTKLFTKCKYFSENIVDDDEIQISLKNKNFSKVFNSKRGGGYWIWKPYIIYKMLKKINENDIIVYSDAGCTIPNNKYVKDKLKEYLDIINKSKKGLIAFKNPHKESEWTKGDIFKHFKCLDNKDMYDSNQFTANRIILKKNNNSVRIIKSWWDVAKTHPLLFNDSISKVPNFNDFIENRHDQSIFSIICKMSDVEIINDWKAIPIKASRIRK